MECSFLLEEPPDSLVVPRGAPTTELNQDHALDNTLTLDLTLFTDRVSLSGLLDEEDRAVVVPISGTGGGALPPVVRPTIEEALVCSV